MNSELGYELREICKDIPKHQIKEETFSNVETKLKELAAFKKKIELNILRMVTIKDKIEEMAGIVQRVDVIVQSAPE